VFICVVLLQKRKLVLVALIRGVLGLMTLFKAGIRIDSSTAMIAMTTRSSIRVNPLRLFVMILLSSSFS
jgi:hypothetical protein